MSLKVAPRPRLFMLRLLDRCRRRFYLLRLLWRQSFAPSWLPTLPMALATLSPLCPSRYSRLRRHPKRRTFVSGCSTPAVAKGAATSVICRGGLARGKKKSAGDCRGARRGRWKRGTSLVKLPFILKAAADTCAWPDLTVQSFVYAHNHLVQFYVVPVGLRVNPLQGVARAQLTFPSPRPAALRAEVVEQLELLAQVLEQRLAEINLMHAELAFSVIGQSPVVPRCTALGRHQTYALNGLHATAPEYVVQKLRQGRVAFILAFLVLWQTCRSTTQLSALREDDVVVVGYEAYRCDSLAKTSRRLARAPLRLRSTDPLIGKHFRLAPAADLPETSSPGRAPPSSRTALNILELLPFYPCDRDRQSRLDDFQYRQPAGGVGEVKAP